MNVNVDSIPGELKHLRQWVAWKYDFRDGRGGPAKPPVNPHTMAPARVNDPAAWGTFEDAQAAAAKHGMAGVGFVFVAGGGMFGIDLDDCVDVAGNISPLARSIIEKYSTYTEISPSGRGVKLFVKGDISPGCPSKIVLDESIMGISQVEAYGHGRYFTVTGWRLPWVPAVLAGPVPMTPAFGEFLERLFKKRRLDGVAASSISLTNPQPVAAPAPPAPSVPDTMHPALTDPKVIRRCEAYLRKIGPAISGQGGHDRTLRAACEIFRFGLSDAEA